MSGFKQNIGTDETIRHIPKFSGEIWYVSKNDGSNTNTGKYPDNSFETIGTAISAMSNGDAISVKAGTYTEIGLDLSNDAAEIWFEPGVVLNPATGIALTISGEACSVTGRHKIIGVTGEIGILISGISCYLEQGRIIGGDIGISITALGAIIKEYGATQQIDIAYNLTGGQTKLFNCSTLGVGNTYGYKINSGADTGVLIDCTSVGHTTSGYYIDSGSKDWTIINCSSGAGDGKWRDIDRANIWSNFSYDNVKFKEITGNGVLQTFDLFKITGSIKVTNPFAHVSSTDITCGGACTVKLELESNGATQDISTAAGNINGLLQGSIIVKDADTGQPLSIGDNNGDCVVVENANYRDPNSPLILVQESGQDTHIQFVTSDVMDADSKLHWHIEWEPITDDGFLIPA